MRLPAIVSFLLLACTTAATGSTTRPRPSFDELILTIRTGNAYQRAEVIGSLSCLDDPRVVPELIALLKDEDARVRSEAAQHLARLADERSTDALVVALADKVGNVRRFAADGLLKAGNQRHVPALVASVMDHLPGPTTSESALEAIGKLSPKAPDELIGLLERIPTVRSSTNNDWWRLLESVARCLGEIGDRAALEPLQQARQALEAGHQDYKTWYAVRKALAAIDPEKMSFDRPAADILDLDRVGKIDDEGIQQKWILPLVGLGDRAIQDLDWALWFQSEWDRERVIIATKVLSEIGGRSAANALRRYMARQLVLPEQDQHARHLFWRAILLALLKTDPNEATVEEIFPISQQLTDVEQGLLVYDVSNVPPERMPQQIKTLFYRRSLLGSTSARPLNPPATSRAAQLLGQIGGQEPGEILSKALLDPLSRDWGQAAASALGEIKGYDSAPVLMTALESANVNKGAVARALGMIADRRAVPPLKDAVHRAKLDGQDRLWIAAALAHLGEDYVDNARLIREALPGSLEQARWLHDEQSILAIAAFVNAEGVVGETAIHTLETIGSDRAFNALVAQVDVERITDPLHLQQVAEAAARMAQRLGRDSRECWTTVATVAKAVRGWFSTGQMTLQLVHETLSAEPVMRALPLARRVWVGEVNRRLDLAASGQTNPYQFDLSLTPLSTIPAFFAPELVPTLERIARESDSIVDLHARYGIVKHYNVRSRVAKILTEKTGHTYTFVDADGRTHPGGWSPSRDE